MRQSGQSFELMMAGRDLPWLLRQWADRTPDKAFLIWAPHEGDHRQWTYAAFASDVQKAAGGLHGLGVRKGDRVLIHMENAPELLLSYFACAYIGAVAVLGNTRSAGPELDHYLSLVKPVGIVTQNEFAPLFEACDAEASWIACNNGEAGTGPKGVPRLDFAVIFESEPVLDYRPAEPFLDLRVQFTSGTTSRPKAVLSTHANSLYAGQQVSYAYNLRSDDICQIVVPLFHNNGISVQLMGTLWSGGTIVLQQKFSASRFWKVAMKYQATWSSLPGMFFWRALADKPVPDHSFRFWYGAVLPEYEEKFRVKMRGHWGMSETISLPIVGDPFHEGGILNIGRPAPGSEIEIRRDDGSFCHPGETGRLYLRGNRGVTLFKEYLGDPEATAASFDAAGWFDTGDLIRIGEDGDLFFAGRAKDMLRIGGENVAAAEIEQVIQETGWVEECAVVGKPHDMLDEVPVAFVIPNSSAPADLEAALIAHCQSHLADFKVLREVHLVEDLPRSTMSKIAKHALQARLISSEDTGPGKV